MTHMPQDARGHHILATILLRLNDTAGAIEAFRRALRLDPLLTEARVNLSRTLQQTGQTEEARRELAEIRRINEEKARASQAMVAVETAMGHANQGDFAAALRQLRDAVKLSPRFAEAHYQLALALRRASADDREIEAALKRVIELNASHAEAHYELALLFNRRGQAPEAVASFRRAIDLAPGLTEAHRELAKTAVAGEDWPTAMREFTSILAWDPGDAGSRHALGHALLQQRQWNAAAAELQTVIAMDPGLAEAHYDLGMAWRALGREGEAAEHLGVARKLNPALIPPE
jgi:tetratricopeptide (TPR) repeat protein